MPRVLEKGRDCQFDRLWMDDCLNLHVKQENWTEIVSTEDRRNASCIKREKKERSRMSLHSVMSKDLGWDELFLKLFRTKIHEVKDKQKNIDFDPHSKNAKCFKKPFDCQFRARNIVTWDVLTPARRPGLTKNTAESKNMLQRMLHCATIITWNDMTMRHRRTFLAWETMYSGSETMLQHPDMYYRERFAFRRNASQLPDWYNVSQSTFNLILLLIHRELHEFKNPNESRAIDSTLLLESNT